MITSSLRLYRSLLIVGDACCVAVTYVVADILRCTLYMQGGWPEALPNARSPYPIHFWLLAVLPVAWPVILGLCGWYDARAGSRWWQAGRCITATLVLVMVAASMVLVFQREAYPRAQLGFLAIMLPATTMLARGISELVGAWYSGRRIRHVLIVGTGRDALRMRRLMRAMAFGRPEVIGHLRLPGGAGADAASAEQTGAILGDVSLLPDLLENRVVDEVLFAVPLDQLQMVLPHIALCEEVGVMAAIIGESSWCHAPPQVAHFHGVPLLTFAAARHSPELLFVKRACDVAGALAGIALLWWLMLLTAAAIKFSSRGPIFFRQRRVGQGGRTFTLYKFRSMREGAEHELADLAHLNKLQGPATKLDNDPRITTVGRWLRKFSIDELPQLWNVLKGEMSLVGPRPPLPDEVRQYDRWQRRRLSMRPGLTCLWQINGRHEIIDVAEWMKLDLFYIDHWSLRMDFLIVFKTIVTVLSGSGA